MANDQQNHNDVNNSIEDVDIQDGLSAEELFANRDGLTYKWVILNAMECTQIAQKY